MIDDIIGESTAIFRKRSRTSSVIGKSVRQQLFRQADCVLSRIAARMFQLMREDANEPIILGRLPVEIRFPLFSHEKNCLHRSPTALCLAPASYGFFHCASPDSNFIGSESRVGQRKRDAADVFVRKKILARELHMIEIAVGVEKERIAAPTKEKTIVAGFRYQGFAPNRDWCLLDYDFAVVARANSSRPLSTTNCRGLRAILRSGELYAVTDVGNGIAVVINFDFIECPGGERLSCCGRQRIHGPRHGRVEDDDRFSGITWLRKDVEISHVQSGIAVRKSEVRTGGVVGHL